LLAAAVEARMSCKILGARADGVKPFIFLLGDNLVSAVFGGSGAIAITMANPIKQNEKSTM
jgi:hypothetical protein